MMPEKPMSLPPICTVTSDVFDVTAFSCGGSAMPSAPLPPERMSSVVAPEQLTSANDDELAAVATSDG
jgi:hypothetical protein